MRKFDKAFNNIWRGIHIWWIGIPLLLLFVMLLCVSSVEESKEFVVLPLAGKPQEVIGKDVITEEYWSPFKLPVKVHPQGGFMGHGGYCLPSLFANALIFALIWALAAFFHCRFCPYEYETSFWKEHLLAKQILIFVLKILILPCSVLLFCIVAGNKVIINLLFLLLLYFFFLVAYRVVIPLISRLRK